MWAPEPGGARFSIESRRTGPAERGPTVVKRAIDFLIKWVLPVVALIATIAIVPYTVGYNIGQNERAQAQEKIADLTDQVSQLESELEGGNADPTEPDEGDDNSGEAPAAPPSTPSPVEPDNNDAVELDAEVSLEGHQGIDFDTGVVVPPFSEGDELLFQNNRFSTMGRSVRVTRSPSPSVCQEALENASDGAVHGDLEEGQWFCSSTDEGQVAGFQIVQVREAQPTLLALRYAVWPGT